MFLHRNENERLVLEEAQVRYELEALKREYNQESEKREVEHQQQIQMMEQVGIKYNRLTPMSFW